MKLVSIKAIRVGDEMPTWLGTVTAIRDTAQRRYITVQRADGSTYTNHQSNDTNVFVSDPGRQVR